MAGAKTISEERGVKMAPAPRSPGTAPPSRGIDKLYEGEKGMQDVAPRGTLPPIRTDENRMSVATLRALVEGHEAPDMDDLEMEEHELDPGELLRNDAAVSTTPPPSGAGLAAAALGKLGQG